MKLRAQFALVVAGLGGLYAQAPSGAVVATANGIPVYESELGIQTKLAQLRRQEYDAKVQAAREVAARKILEKAAADKGLPLDKFLASEVDNKVGEPTEAELRAYFLGKQSEFGSSFEKAEDQVRQSYRQARLQQIRQEFGQKLFQSADIRILLAAPRNEISFGAGPRKGKLNAPVTIVEFSDFQCPYCKAALPTLKQIAEKYGDKIQWQFKNFPLNDIHPQAQSAAEAAHCAEEQGKFWDYHDALFAMAPNFDQAGFLAAAVKTGVADMEKFKGCLDSRKYKSAIEEDTAMGQQVGVDGTPMFFINGVSLSGAAPLADFERIIDGELQNAK